jgi:long-chain-fatty-acid--CoA ligase ACSBG
MIKMGLMPYHGVSIIGFNSPEWLMAYVGCIKAGGIAVGVYATNNSDACHFIADNSRTQLFFCENDKQLSKIKEIKERLPNLKAIVKYLPDSLEPLSDEMKQDGVMTWEEFLELGKDVPDDEVSLRVNEQKPNKCASLIYTSGTTGPPKGVMLSNDNLVWMGRRLADTYNATFVDYHISYLPLSHIAGQMVDIVIPAINGSLVYFAQPDAIRGTLKDTILEVRPTIFFAVPRIWEKFRDAIEGELSKTTGLKLHILSFAKSIGRKAQDSRVHGQPGPFGYWLADRLVFKSLRDKMGLDNCRVMSSAAAPLPSAVTEFFANFDIPIHQVYGMSECSGVSTVNVDSSFIPGSVGKAMDGLEVMIDQPDKDGNGEICFRGRHVFMGYLYQDQKTADTIDDQGWLHSGDIGKIDDKGFFYITGRLKELIITKGGENIAPIPIEEAMKENIKLISNVMVIGDDKRFLTMVVTLRCVMVDGLVPSDELDGIAMKVINEIGSNVTTVTEAREDPIVLEYIRQGMEKANELAISRAAKVQKFAILPTEFSIGGGEMTPTLKLKRSVVAEKYQDIINDLYTE